MQDKMTRVDAEASKLYQNCLRDVPESKAPDVPNWLNNQCAVRNSFERYLLATEADLHILV